MILFAGFGPYWERKGERIPEFLAFAVALALLLFGASGVYSALSRKLPAWWTRVFKRRG